MSTYPRGKEKTPTHSSEMRFWARGPSVSLVVPLGPPCGANGPDSTPFRGRRAHAEAGHKAGRDAHMQRKGFQAAGVQKQSQGTFLFHRGCILYQHGDSRPRGPMDKASAYGAGDCRLESFRVHESVDE